MNNSQQQADKEELERFKTLIDLSEYAASEGFKLNTAESCRTITVMKRADDEKIIIRRHENDKWSYYNVHDNSGGDRGSIIDFIKNREGLTLGGIRQKLRQWLGSEKPTVAVTSYQPNLKASVANRKDVLEALSACRIPTSWPYLESRGLTLDTLTSPRFAGLILEGEYRNMIFPHRDKDGFCGYEAKNKGFTGFAPGGTKSVWHSHTKSTDTKLVFCEVGIDALSYYQLFDDGNTRYMSFAGGLNDYQRETVIPAAISKMPVGSTIVSAFDNNKAGDKFHDLVTPHVTSDYVSHRHSPPPELDWNDVVQGVTK